MKISVHRKNQLVESNQKSYGNDYNRIRWINDERTAKALQERSEILSSLKNHAVFCCKNTKVDGGNLSRGCDICTRGDWSCLFVNGRCNCRCFYCPTKQDEIDVPTTNTVPFPKVNDYIDYIRKLEFKGVSLSGGEPLLTLEASLSFLQKIHDEFDDSVYTWLYTNGTLATRETLLKLRDAGLKEIRFDIGAMGMSLERANSAVDIIDTVTVEIPALPEEYELMKTKIREMQSAGIRHLNLHQLRLTPHNFSKLTARNYTFLHGEKVTVLESELTALKLIRWIHEEGIRFPINYCSFVYKNRFQRAAARRKSASFVCKPYENITQNGYIRALEIEGEPGTIASLIEVLSKQEGGNNSWNQGSRKDRLIVNETVFPFIDKNLFLLYVNYAEARLAPAVTYRNYFVEIPLNPQRSLYVEKASVSEKMKLDRDSAEYLFRTILSSEPSSDDVSENVLLEKIRSFELIEEDLAEYF